MKRTSYAALATLALIPLVVASALPLRPPEIVPCGFLRVTGYPCPFCGTTRAFTAMGHGQAVHAVSLSPLGALGYVLAAGLLLFALAGLVHPAAVEGIRRSGADLLRCRWLWIAVAGAVAANWAYRLAVGLK